MITVSATSITIDGYTYPLSDIYFFTKGNKIGISVGKDKWSATGQGQVDFSTIINEATGNPFGTMDELKAALKAGFKSANGTGGAVSGLLALNSRIGYIGDSITAIGLVDYVMNNDNHSSAHNNNGFTTFANGLAKSAFYVPHTGNQGVNGDPTTAILARIDVALSLNPKVEIILAGTNDLAASTPASTIIANLNSIYNAFIANGCKVVAVKILPRFAPAALSGGNEASRITVNNWIETKRSDNILVVDCESLLNTSHYNDGLHLNSDGAFIVGNQVARELRKLIAPDNIAGGLLPATTFCVNPRMSGSAGTKNTAVGVVATGWQLSSADAGGAVVTGSKGMDGEQILTFSGNYSGAAGRRVEMLNTVQVANIEIGDKVEGVIDFEITEPLAGVCAVGFKMSAFSEGFANQVGLVDSLAAADTNLLQLPVGRYTFRTPVQVFNEKPAFINNYVEIKLFGSGSAIPISGIVKIHSAGVSPVKNIW